MFIIGEMVRRDGMLYFYYSRFHSGGFVIFGGVFLNDVYSCVSLLVLYSYVIFLCLYM